ncbi:hypothetical protein N7532_011451 [Penicillium argentinense]|uniref:Phenol 2-monooxygenase n=1 Tax=Penicillium argentinense TaxID=1131581 RepID=A0A9W9JUV0_9EURO|nr:uncharacterized protein N7532_011451 [Penicillium argentinense]KAJ5082408.1 hypothetical protein N7532_011451 [Penicillium argentinense]
MTMTQETEAVESQTDVLIIGAGPSGLMAAYWMAVCGVRARIIDKKGTKVFTGQADGLRPRTLELFDSMGFQHRVIHEGHVAVEANFWVPDENGKLTRQGPHCSPKINESNHYNMLLNQGRIERFVIDTIHKYSDLEVERGVIAESFEYDETLEDNPDAYPITVKLRTLSDEEANPAHLTTNGSGPPTAFTNGMGRGSLLPDDWEELIQKSRARQAKTEIVKAKYIIGCDGAHSWTRKQVNIPLEGSMTEHIWGVIDVVPLTNFPDIRRLGTITHSSGTILVIPRERRMVRLYVPVQIVDASTNGRFDRSTITLEMIKARVQAIMSPFTFDFQVCDWWTAYQVGQRVAPTFNKGTRIFLAGDAVHTHSPKVGLGMNMSMQDGFNIGWKVAMVAVGAANPAILNTYTAERHPLAEMLLEFDRLWSGEFTETSTNGTTKADKADRMVDVVESFMDFADGLKAYYPNSSLVWKVSEEEGPAAARNLIPGERIPPMKLRNQAEGNSKWTTRLFESDGPFRIIILAGDVRVEAQQERVAALARILEGEDKTKVSPLCRYMSIPGRESLIEIVTIHSAPWEEVEFFDFPEILRPFDPVMGWGYENIWCDASATWDPYCQGKGYEKWGVDRLRGAMLVLRPDQYIGWSGELEEVDDMTAYLDGVLIKVPTPEL